MLFQIGLIVFDKNWFLTSGVLEVGNCTEELNCIDTVGYIFLFKLQRVEVKILE